MSQNRIGVFGEGRNTAEVLAGIRQAEEQGIPAVWPTSMGANRDSVSVLVAAAVQTRRVLLGTMAVHIWPRHPVLLAQELRVLANLAPGRVRVGLSPASKRVVEGSYGLEYRMPLGHLREYVQLLKSLLSQGAGEFDGRYYRCRWRSDSTVEVPIMVTALRQRAFELAGAVADGAITSQCPGLYLRDVALPAMRAGAEAAGRPAPPLLARLPICVHDDPDQARAAARKQLAAYVQRNPAYIQMFAAAGFPEAAEGS